MRQDTLIPDSQQKTDKVGLVGARLPIPWF